MGCCLGVSLLAGAPRLALLIWWFSDAARVTGTFAAWPKVLAGLSLPNWAWPLAGLLLMPWLTVGYIWVAPGGVAGWEWAVLAIALLFDLSTHGGSGREASRRRSKD